MPSNPVITRYLSHRKWAIPFGLVLSLATPLFIVPRANAEALSPASRHFLDQHCFECHDAEMKKGGLDLTALKLEPANPTNFTAWVAVHDRVVSGEMPPKKKPRPEAAETTAFTKTL